MKKASKDYLIQNGSYKVVALLIALILWITVLGNKDQILNQTVQLKFFLPENHMISSPVINQVQVQVSGSRLSLKKISKGVEPIEINLSEVRAGRTIVSIPLDGLDLPFGSQILSMNPSSVVVDVDRVLSKRVPVRLQWDLEEDPKDIVLKKISPRTVVIKGAASVLPKIQEILTDPISPGNIDFTSKKQIDVRTGLRDFNFFGVLPHETRAVTVTLEKK